MFILFTQTINRHYPPGTQENYNSFSSRNHIIGKGKGLEFPEGRGGFQGSATQSGEFPLSFLEYLCTPLGDVLNAKECR
jgi:hypothetical protein